MTDQPYNTEADVRGDVTTTHIPAPEPTLVPEVVPEAVTQEAQPEAPQETMVEAVVEETAEVQPAEAEQVIVHQAPEEAAPTETVESALVAEEAVEPLAATPQGEAAVIEYADPVTETAPAIPEIEPYRGRLSEEFTPQEQAEASVQGDEAPKKKSMRGFASMSPERRREIAAKGGAAVPKDRRAYSQNRDLAREAGKKGGSVKGKYGPRKAKPKPEAVAPVLVQEAPVEAPVEAIAPIEAAPAIQPGTVNEHINEVTTEVVQEIPVEDVTTTPVEPHAEVQPELTPEPEEQVFAPVAEETPPTE